MKASIDGYIVAQSDEIVACAGYQYFPRAQQCAWIGWKRPRRPRTI